MSRNILNAFVVVTVIVLGACASFSLSVKEKSKPAAVVQQPPAPLEVRVTGPGVIKFTTYSKGAIAVDGEASKAVDGSIYKVSYPDGSYGYTEQPTYIVEKEAVVRIDEGDFTFYTESQGTISLGSGKTAKISGQGWASVHQDMYVFMCGNGLFEAHNLPCASVSKRSFEDDCKLLSVNCPVVLYGGRQLNYASNDRSLFLYYDETSRNVVACQSKKS